MGSLKGKVAVITGGNSGIGKATARLFVEEGAQVVITGRRQDVVADAVREIGAGASGFCGDVADIDFHTRLAADVRSRFGAIDIYMANAGIINLAGSAISMLPPKRSCPNSVPGPVNCILADVRMTGMSGIDMLGILQAKPDCPPVLIMTSYGDARMEGRALSGGQPSGGFRDRRDPVGLQSAAARPLFQTGGIDRPLMRAGALGREDKTICTWTISAASSWKG